MAVGFRGMTLAAAALAAMAGPSPAGPPPSAPAAGSTLEASRGMGQLCAVALLTVAAEVGRRCRPSPDPLVQAELDASVARLDAFILANSKWDRADLDRFKRDQAELDRPEEAFCTGEIVAIHNAFAGAGPDELRRWSEKLVSRPGPPVWGDCL